MRCENLGQQCVYAESKVGRIPRNRRRHQDPSDAVESASSLTANSGQTEGVSSAGITQLSADAGIDIGDALMQNGDFESSMIRYPVDFPSSSARSMATYTGSTVNFDNFNVLGHFNASSITRRDSFSPGTDSIDPRLDLNGEPLHLSQDMQIDFGLEGHNSSRIEAQSVEQSSRLFPSTTHDFAGLDSQHRMASSDQTAASTRKLHSQIVISATQIASKLEDYILSELKALDLALQIARDALAQLNKLIDLQQADHNFRCIALLYLILSQIVELLESSASIAFTNTSSSFSDGSSQSSMPEINGGFIPNRGALDIGIGAFRASAEEQQTWRARIVLKDLGQCSETLQRISILGKPASRSRPLTPGSESSSPCSSNPFGEWMTEIQDRLGTMARRLKRV